MLGLRLPGAEMEEPEFEGVACHYKDDTSIDPDIALSYIDEKLQSVLGHLQKDFEGGVSAENLGAKFGGYGSFLPMYQRSPSLWSHPKSPPTVQSQRIPRSSNTLSMEGASRGSVTPSDAPLPPRQGNASHVMPSLNNPKVSSREVSARQDSFLSSAQVAERFPMRHELSLSKLANPTNRKGLTVRIKVGSDNTAQKKEIYSALGFISPSSSIGNSPERSGGMPFDVQEALNESPTSILQIMASSPVPGTPLLSPLHDFLLCLIETEKPSLDSKLAPVFRGRQENSAISVNDSACKLGNGKVLKKKKMKSTGKGETFQESKSGNDMDVIDDMVSLSRKKTASETIESKQCFSKELKLNPLSNSICDIDDSLKGARATAEVSREAEKVVPVKKREVNKYWMKDRLPSSDLAEESLESINGQDDGKYHHQETRNSLVGKIEEHTVRGFCKVVSVDHKQGGTSEFARDPFEAEFDVRKCESEFKGAMDDVKRKVGPKATSHGQDEMKIYAMKKSYEGKRKSRGSQSNSKLASALGETLRVGSCSAPKNMKSGQNDFHKVHDSYKEVLNSRSENLDNQIDPLNRQTSDSANYSNLETNREHHAFVDKLTERTSCKKVDVQLTSETFLKVASNIGPPPTKGFTSETEMASVAPVVIEEDWVCCDHCQKWRLLPYGMKPEQLPEKWLCSMLNWLPGMNQCDISEEETTKALHELYQLPLAKSQNNFQNNADRTASGVTSADARHFNLNRQNLSSDALLDQGKKKYKSKETSDITSNGGLIQTPKFGKNSRQEAGKSRRLNDTQQPLSETNLMSKSNGNTKQKKKSKGESDQMGYGTTKKIKIATDTDKHWTSEHVGELRVVGASSNTDLLTKAAGKDMRRHSGQSYSKDANCDPKNRLLISVKKHRDHDVNMGTSDGREVYGKKRKLKDWQESQNHLIILQNNGSHPPDGKVSVKEDSGDSEFRKEKKSRMSRTEGKNSSTSKGDDGSNKNGRMARILLSGGRGKSVERNVENNQQPMKDTVKVASQASLYDLDSLKRDLGPQQLSMAATSSSSKVSDSHKPRANYQEVKGSPVESVSSSPMRTFNSDKLSPARINSSGKDDAKHDDFLLVGSPGKHLDRDGNFEISQSWTAMKGKTSGVFHPESSGFPTHDFRDTDAKQKFGVQSESISKHLCEVGNDHLGNSDADIFEGHGPCPSNMHASYHFSREVRADKNHLITASPPQISINGSLLQSKDMYTGGHNRERGTGKVSKPLNEQGNLSQKKSLRDETHIGPHYHTTCHEELGDVNNIIGEHTIKSINGDKSVGKKTSGKWVSDHISENMSKFGEHDSSDVKLGAPCSTDGRVTAQQNLTQDIEGEIARKGNSTQVESRRGKSLVNTHYTVKQHTLVRVPQSVPGSLKGSLLDVRPVEPSVDGDVSNVLKQPGNAVSQNGAHQSMQHPVSDQYLARDLSAPSHVKWDAASQPASNALKEAEDLRDYADHLKISGFGFECNEAYFQAALKFLHCASLLETCNRESSKHGQMTQMQVYSNTAQLCENCAHEYEKCQEMAAASLAYKCMEVAYMRVVYCKNSSTNRDRQDLQASLQMVPQGESPSSSASDIDSLNNQAMMEKVAFSKGLGSQSGNHVVRRNCPNFVRLLDFVREISALAGSSRQRQPLVSLKSFCIFFFSVK
ncbi:unnamed protein product [Ilex paraguariensis]|uniref:CW-type domain-containing protein n=1 Tax=Ilex paraguariensis TaxID=185542 RepID=A0ABC8SPA5_9AQUA